LEVDFIIGTQVNSTKMASIFIKTNLYQISYTEFKKSNTLHTFSDTQVHIPGGWRKQYQEL
jgi:hypothetical protein